MEIAMNLASGEIDLTHSSRTLARLKAAVARVRAWSAAAVACDLRVRTCLLRCCGGSVGGWQRFAAAKQFEWTVMVVIVTNTVVMAMDSSPPPFGLSQADSDDLQAAKLLCAQWAACTPCADPAVSMVTC